VATGQLRPEQLRDFATVGELALDGSVWPVKGALSMAMAAAARGVPKSARAHDRILRMARTVADLEGEPDLRPAHVVEAIGYRSLDRKLWAR
jgi:predicted ATPase with chaperone activity